MGPALLLSTKGPSPCEDDVESCSSAEVYQISGEYWDVWVIVSAPGVTLSFSTAPGAPSIIHGRDLRLRGSVSELLYRPF